MKVINRSDGRVVYSLPELNNTRRLFEPGEEKELSNDEVEALFQLAGGAELIRDFLLINDEKWVKEHWDAPLEYFWNVDEIRKCLLEDSLELFSETLDYAPAGVKDIIKRLAWQIPLTDLNKIKIIEEKLGFDVQAAVGIMASSIFKPKKQVKTQGRLRKVKTNDTF